MFTDQEEISKESEELSCWTAHIYEQRIYTRRWQDQAEKSWNQVLQDIPNDNNERHGTVYSDGLALKEEAVLINRYRSKALVLNIEQDDPQAAHSRASQLWQKECIRVGGMQGKLNLCGNGWFSS